MIHDVKKQVEKVKKLQYYQFDWTCEGITIFRFKWYIESKGGFNLFYPQSYNIMGRNWQSIIQLSMEKRNQLMAECEEKWGKVEKIEPIMVVKPKVKMFYYERAFGPEWKVYEKYKDRVDKNFDRWLADGMLIEER